MIGLAAMALACAGCSRSAQQPAVGTTSDTPRPEQAAEFTPIKEADQPGVHNLVRVSERIYSGSEPHGQEGFASLARLGVKTVVSVDGARPQLDEAKKHGLNYVHIPIGYDGIDGEAALALVRVGRESEGPIYIHCHHGQHRGPAAAAVACMAGENRTGKQALKILEVAGTGKQYPGLWRDVEGFEPPVADTVFPDLVEVAEVESFAAAMAKIDRNYDNLKLCQQAGWSVPPDHPDVVPLQESVILKEGFRETTRNLIEDRPAEFKTWMAEAADLSDLLEAALRQNDHAAAGEAFQRIDASCKKCHGKYRNQSAKAGRRLGGLAHLQ